MNITRRGVALGLGSLAAAQGAAYLLYQRVARERTAAAAGPFSYEPMDGRSFDLLARVQQRDERELALSGMLGQPLLLHFWATWCEPCRIELPQLLGLEEPAVLFISVDEAWPVVEHFFKGRLPPRVVLDAGGEARRTFGITTLPDSYLLDGAGRMLARFHGPRPWAHDEAKATLQRLLNR